MSSKVKVNSIIPSTGTSVGIGTAGGTVNFATGTIVTGVSTATNFKTGTTNVHNAGVELAGINVIGANTPIGA